MKRLLILLPFLLYGAEFGEVAKMVEHSGLLKAKDFEIKAQQRLYESEKGKNLFSLDASLEGIYLKTQPSINLHIPAPNLPPKFPAGAKRQFYGEVRLSYPLFSGFAISSMIQKAEWNKKKSQLEREDLKRNLYLKAASLYAATVAVKKEQKALEEALRALDLSLKKAKGFYKEQLVPLSEVKNIEAKLYSLKASLSETRVKEKNLLAQLSYLTHSKIDSVGSLLPLSLPKNFTIEDRADIKALYTMLRMDKADIRLARSSYYPKVVLLAALKGFGDTLSFEGDGFRNGDQSFIGFALRQNLFNGFSDRAKVEAARYKKLARMAYIADYKRKVLTQLMNDRRELEALKERKMWAKKELESQRSYYELVKGRFENQLASADELSRSIASLEAARAKLAAVKAKIFVQKAKILLEISTKEFERRIGL